MATRTFATYSQLPDATTLGGAEILSLDQANVTSRATISQISNFIHAAPLLSVMNLSASKLTESASLTFTADQVTLGTSLSGAAIVVSSVNVTNTLTTSGAGGLDIGTATTPGYVGVYLIYNTATQTTSTLATAATSTVLPEIYAGGSMPSGYTYSRLISVWAIGASNNTYAIGQQKGRVIQTLEAVYTTDVGPITWTSLSIPSVPKNAKTIKGRIGMVVPNTGIAPVFIIAPVGSTVANQITQGKPCGATSIASNALIDLPIITPQTVYYQVTGNQSFVAGSGFTTCGYSF